MSFHLYVFFLLRIRRSIVKNWNWNKKSTEICQIMVFAQKVLTFAYWRFEVILMFDKPLRAVRSISKFFNTLIQFFSCLRVNWGHTYSGPIQWCAVSDSFFWTYACMTLQLMVDLCSNRHLVRGTYFEFNDFTYLSLSQTRLSSFSYEHVYSNGTTD